jgi:hypothetical protein
VSYDPLRQRVTNAQATLQGLIRRARQDLANARTRLEVLEELEGELNLDAIVDAIPEAAE